MSGPLNRFEETIETRARLRELVSEPPAIVTGKVIDRIDDLCRRFIGASPFVMVATRGADGRLDISPKGDAPGFVAVLDDKTVAIPDRPGNLRADTFENLLAHPEVGLIFIIPGRGDTLRVSGKGRIVRDRALQEKLAANGKVPHLVLIVDVEEAFTHCPKCMTRAKMWTPDEWPDHGGAPTHAELMVAHGKLKLSVTTMQSIVDKDGETRLY